MIEQTESGEAEVLEYYTRFGMRWMIGRLKERTVKGLTYRPVGVFVWSETEGRWLRMRAPGNEGRPD